MCLQFGFLIFWRKVFGTKAAHKMLVKLTPLGGQTLEWTVLQQQLKLFNRVTDKKSSSIPIY
jgi:hypothetical protein